MEDIFEYPMNDYRSFSLEHHGIKGQKWGVRNADWYPIAAFKAASGKVKNKVSEMRTAHAKKVKAKKRAKNLEKARKARAEKLAEQKKQEELNKKFEEDKEKVLRSGTPGDIIKLAPKLSTRELQDAVQRNQALENLKAAEKKRISDIQEEEFEKKYAKVNAIAKNVRKIGDIANTGVEAYNKVQKVLDIINGEDKTPSIADILKDPSKYSDAQVQRAKQREDNLKSMRPKPTTAPSAEDVLKNPSKYTDEQIDAASKRDQRIAIMRKNNSASSETTNQHQDFKEVKDIFPGINESTLRKAANVASTAYDAYKFGQKIKNGESIFDKYDGLSIEGPTDNKRRR